jgi:hypothetical protein
VRSWWWRGLALMGLVAVTVSTAAYLGLLPRWISRIPHFDTACHFLLIGLVAFFLDGALRRRGLWKRHWFPPLAAVLVLGAAGADELAQGLSRRRTMDWTDFAADTAGVCALTWLSRRVGRRPPVEQEQQPQPQRRSVSG